MPCVTRPKRVSPAECRITHRPVVPVRAIGPGVGAQTSPVSSSRTNNASAVGSVTGSFAKGVRRFSRLFPAHVWAAPDEVTTVPN